MEPADDSPLAKYLKKNLPADGHLPTLDKCLAAIKQPEKADPGVLRCLELRPDLRRLLIEIPQQLRDLGEAEWQDQWWRDPPALPDEPDEEAE